MKVVIVGGVAGGATAAARLRRLDENAEIVILERSGFVSYANCGLPYYVGGVIEEEEELTLQTPESFRQRFRIDVRVEQEVLALDPVAKTVRVRRLEDGSEYIESYDKLLLAPGAKAVRPDVPGVENDRIVTLRTVEDTLRIRKLVEKRGAKRVIIVGGGFIGLEMAENLLHAKVETTLLQRSEHVMPTLDYDMACQVHAYLRSQGLDLRLRTPVVGYEAMENGVRVLLRDGASLEAEFVLLAVGVMPEAHLAQQAGLALGQRGAIAVNDRMQTSQPDIYAVGDAVEITNFVSGKKTLVSLAGPANKQGRIVADNLCGRDSVYRGAQGSTVMKLFSMTVASTGLNEKAAEWAGLSYEKVITNSTNHATYYPGVSNMTIKVLFQPEDGRILGAQIVGRDGVDKRIDVLATAVRAGMTAADLEELDLAYAPPYSSAKDPVNMAGFMIENIRSGLVKQYHWSDLAALPTDGSILHLDVRTQGEHARGAIPGTINIPLDELRERLGELDRSKPVYVNCFSGLRSYLACRILTQHGFDCYNFSGGYHFYRYILRESRYDPDPTYLCGIKIASQ